jgi:hypothetical protein
MFGHSVQEIERSHHHVVILETATSGAVATFAFLVVLVLLVYEARQAWRWLRCLARSLCTPALVRRSSETAISARLLFDAG